jgi:hypothetical protein
MHPSKTLFKFTRVFETWEKALDTYSEADFLRKPSDEAWSIGQVYVHLTGSAKFFHLKNVSSCIQNEENVNATKTMPGRISYFLGGMPPIKIKVPASPEYTPPQPKNIAEVKEYMAALKLVMAETTTKLAQNQSKGKSKHPAFGYLNAAEWFQLIEMHFRHHLHQKSRLDKFLKNG